MPATTPVSRQLTAEFVGTAALLATVLGSGIMAERLSDGNDAIALLGNTGATGAILYVLIVAFGPISGAHFNPAVTLAFALRKEIDVRTSWLYVLVQVAGGLVGMLAAHLMFEEDLFQISEKARSGAAQGLSELIATFGLVAAILLTIRAKESAVAAVVALYITAAYWFTASTSFANPAVAIARSFSDTFAGIRPADAPLFIIAEIIGAIVAWAFVVWMFEKD